MTHAVLEVRNVGKSYREFGSEWRRFASWLGFRSSRIKEHWVLRNIGFSVSRGEAVGIVGQNGAGKSTLLKIVTGTLGASEGKVIAAGRIAAILELGMGFNPDLTGRQNVEHSAGLMGFSLAHIQKLLPDIEAFAEIGEYFDEPLRTYSSGMQMRVAFSLATAARPDVLIVDEALSVGDAYFVHKCFKRIRQFREEGTTLLIVSHDKAAIQALCDRAVMIDKGRLVADGSPQEVLDLYNALIAEKETVDTIRQVVADDGATVTTSGTGEASVERVKIENTRGEVIELVGVGDTVDLVLDVLVHKSIANLVIGYMLRDRLGQPVFGTNTHHEGKVIVDARPGDRFQMRARFAANIGVGSYSVSVALASSETHLVNNYEWRDLALVFTVANTTRTTFVGGTWLSTSVSIRQDNVPLSLGAASGEGR
ncbi:ABC transporter ATP-binding protein [Pinirhizobacter soli]|uniref:ABC transporter ATP-binding protein n=1 Tax=Pinirhizobacter soli TaxID=2786953 RepID=UPI00202A2A04|nr:ABC transporter ATP-binding protein [Pinirhizobacter soli]